MTNGLKEGDWVRVKDGGAVGRIVSAGEYVACVERNHIVAEIEARSDLERIDRRTAFLTELKGLLERYDARIYDGELYAVHIELGYHSKDSDEIDYLFYASDNDEINADNIMDFEKD